MYKSPIEMIMGQIRTQQEDHVFKAVQEVGITVDKEELLKALKYDRDQYNNGYHDALVARSMLAEDIKEGVAREIFEEIEEVLKIVKIPCISAEGYITPMRASYWAIDPNDYAELKKKYTEEKKDDNQN